MNFNALHFGRIIRRLMTGSTRTDSNRGLGLLPIAIRKCTLLHRTLISRTIYVIFDHTATEQPDGWVHMCRIVGATKFEMDDIIINTTIRGLAFPLKSKIVLWLLYLKGTIAGWLSELDRKYKHTWIFTKDVSHNWGWSPCEASAPPGYFRLRLKLECDSRKAQQLFPRN